METVNKPCTNNQAVLRWVEESANLCRPAKLFWCDGSESEKELLTKEAVARGILLKLNKEKLPGCYFHRSHPNDVARTEQHTFICTMTSEEAGPTNNWAEPKDMYRKLHAICDGAMKDRTMYVVPYLMGPPGSSMTQVGVELTDSIYVVLSMRIMARMGTVAYQHLGDSEDFNKGLHSMLDLAPNRRYIAHFPQDNAVISVGSDYGGNVLLGKKCLALRLGSWRGHKEGWLAEHMMILKAESPTGEKTFVAGAFPSSCGKTNFAMLVPPEHFKGWKIQTVGDDIAWMKPGEDGRLYAINPEVGYFGVAVGTNEETNPNAMKTIARDTIYTNVALTEDNDVWWEGKTKEPPPRLTDWQGNRWDPAEGPAAHPNSRFTAPVANNPGLAPEINDPKGVPISAIIFGGRRANTLPLVYQAFNWIHGVYIGATLGSETTAAATGAVGQLRRDPMAMLPFCGYNMGIYFQHWLRMRRKIAILPRIFHVNWFRKDQDGNFLWPGYGENMRVLKWVFDRVRGGGRAKETPIGWVPRHKDIDWTGLDFPKAQFEALQEFDRKAWRSEVLGHEELFLDLHSHLPKELMFERELLICRM